MARATEDLRPDEVRHDDRLMHVHGKKVKGGPDDEWCLTNAGRRPVTGRSAWSRHADPSSSRAPVTCRPVPCIARPGGSPGFPTARAPLGSAASNGSAEPDRSGASRTRHRLRRRRAPTRSPFTRTKKPGRTIRCEEAHTIVRPRRASLMGDAVRIVTLGGDPTRAVGRAFDRLPGGTACHPPHTSFTRRTARPWVESRRSGHGRRTTDTSHRPRTTTIRRTTCYKPWTSWATGSSSRMRRPACST